MAPSRLPWNTLSSCALMLSLLCVKASAQEQPNGSWSTANNVLLHNGTAVTLHGLGTTCTEYFLRSLWPNIDCWGIFDPSQPAEAIIQTNDVQLNAIISYLITAKSDSVVPAVRIPMTASYWLGVETNDTKANFERYPNLGGQYQALIQKLVGNYTSNGVVVILDLHWNDDETTERPMALKTRLDGGPTGNAVTFWESVASTFKDNSLVFYEVFNEPHIEDLNVWLNGNGTYAGITELIQAVRKHTETGMIIIAGAKNYAYDVESLITLDKILVESKDDQIMYNFHPYMGPYQEGAKDKCVGGFETQISQIQNQTSKPIIVTEFGQYCCATHGPCENCPAATENFGYDEALLKVCAEYNISWLPWGWRPGAKSPGTQCLDLNGGNINGTALTQDVNGKGANFLELWQEYK